LSNEEKTNDYENFEKGMIYMKILKKTGGSREKGEEETKSMPHAPVSSTCIPRVENVDSAVQITKLGGSDVLNGNKDGCTQEDVFDNLISKKLNEFSSEE
jgi:hypothetical protein